MRYWTPRMVALAAAFSILLLTSVVARHWRQLLDEARG